MKVRNEDFTSLQRYNGSSDVGILTSKKHTKIADNMELDICCLENKDMKMIVKCSEECNDNKSIATMYGALPLMEILYNTLDFSPYDIKGKGIIGSP